MFLEDNIKYTKRFLTEAFPLVSSFFSGSQVELSSHSVQFSTEFDDEEALFQKEIKLRHAIASCSELIQIIEGIEKKISTVNIIANDQTRGLIKGRLDIPRYVNNRVCNISYPKNYPILITEITPNTPENGLAKKLMEVVLNRLDIGNYPRKSAEIKVAKWYYSWISKRLRRPPWCNVKINGSLKLLKQETLRRIARRQTGNEYGYSKLIKFYVEWGYQDFTLGSSVNKNKIIDSLFSFPAELTFYDRIFEIWCLYNISLAFENLGAERNYGPTPLYSNLSKVITPIYIYKYRGVSVEIWFQKSLATSAARWNYVLTDKALQGRPDITLIANGKHYLIFDAKNRVAFQGTRSEETYKILGYLENFRDLFKHSVWATLCFISNDAFTQSLQSIDKGHILLLSAHATDPEKCGFLSQIENYFTTWIDSIIE